VPPHYSADLDYESTTALTAGTYIRDTAGNDATLTLPAVGTMATAYEVNIDGVSPSAFPTGTVVTVGAPVVSGYLNEDNTGINVTVPIADDASLENGKLYIQAKIGANNYANVSSAYTIASGDLNSNKTITAAESDVDGITSFAEGATISFTGLLEDYGDGAGGTGNQTTGTASSTTLIVDQTDPSAFSTGAVTTVTEPVVSGYWNSHNTGITVVVPIEDESTLEDGWVQIIGKTASSSYEDVGDSVQIASGDLGSESGITVSITAAQFEAINTSLSDGDVVTNNYANVSSAYTIASGDLNSNKTITAAESDVDGITSFAEGATISFTGLLEDYGDGAGGTGNQTTGTASSTTLIVDQTDPSAFSTGAVTTVTEPVVSGYWNSHNTGITVVVPIEDESTLEDGWVQIIGKTASSSYEDVGDSVQIASGDLGSESGITVSITAAQFEAINTSLSDGDVVTLNARIDDVAGNATTGTASGTTITVDQTPQTVSYVSSDTTDTNPFKIGDLVPITVKFNGTVNIVITGGTPYLALDTDESPGTATSTAPYSSGTGSTDIIFRYTVAANEYSAELNYINTSSLALNSGTIRDVAGNNATLTLPGIAEDTALKQKKDLWIDGVVPGANTVDSVVTTGGTVMATYWNEDNTGATVKVLLSTSDASLEGGTIN
jgi:predicted RNA binding protein YcfA (HicA-like mRNA interferase family)